MIMVCFIDTSIQFSLARGKERTKRESKEISYKNGAAFACRLYARHVHLVHVVEGGRYGT